MARELQALHQRGRALALLRGHRRADRDQPDRRRLPDPVDLAAERNYASALGVAVLGTALTTVLTHRLTSSFTARPARLGGPGG